MERLECEHGALARSCYTCELLATIAALTERAERAEARVAELEALVKAADRMAMAYAGEMAAKSAGLDIQGFPLLEAYQAFMALNWAALEGTLP